MFQRRSRHTHTHQKFTTIDKPVVAFDLRFFGMQFNFQRSESSIVHRRLQEVCIFLIWWQWKLSLVVTQKWGWIFIFPFVMRLLFQTASSGKILLSQVRCQSCSKSWCCACLVPELRVDAPERRPWLCQHCRPLGKWRGVACRICGFEKEVRFSPLRGRIMIYNQTDDLCAFILISAIIRRKTCAHSKRILNQ